MAGMADNQKTRAPLGVYAIIALVLALAIRPSGHPADYAGGVAELLGRFIGSLLLVAAVGEIIRAFTRSRKKLNPPLPPPTSTP
jgi:hypothetical protein